MVAAGALRTDEVGVYIESARIRDPKTKIPVSDSKNFVRDSKNFVRGDHIKPAHDEWTGKFDGKDYPITGDPDVDTRAYKPINDHTLAFTEKKGGKVVGTGRIVYSADGKTRTVTATETDTKGTKTRATTVYDKQ